MLSLLLVGCSLWLAYGVHLKDPIIALANGFTLAFVFTILSYVLYLKEITNELQVIFGYELDGLQVSSFKATR